MTTPFPPSWSSSICSSEIQRNSIILLTYIWVWFLPDKPDPSFKLEIKCSFSIKSLDFTLVRVLVIVGVEKYWCSEKRFLFGPDSSAICVAERQGPCPLQVLSPLFITLSCSSASPILREATWKGRDDAPPASSCYHGKIWCRCWRTTTIGGFVSKEIDYLLQLSLTEAMETEDSKYLEQHSYKYESNTIKNFWAFYLNVIYLYWTTIFC